MMYDGLALEVGKERYHDLLQESAHERLANQVARRNPAALNRMRQQAGKVVLGVVSRMANMFVSGARILWPSKRSRAKYPRVNRLRSGRT